MVTVRIVSAQSDGSIAFRYADMLQACRVMNVMAETAIQPIAFTVSFEDEKEQQKSRFINPEGEE